MNLSAVILAAGLSRRMGFPKALLRWHDETYLDRLIRLFSAVAADVTVVLRPGAENQLAACTRLTQAKILHNPDADRGQLSSLQTALAVIPAAAVLFSPVDFAHVRESTIHALAHAAPAPVLQPEFQSRHGHPVRVLRPVIDALLAAPPHTPARDVIRQFPRHFIEVDDPGCVEDADDPAAFAALRERLA